MSDYPTDHEFRACIGKARYDSGGAAAKTRDHIGKKVQSTRAKARAKVNIYRCKYCHYWHLGSFRRD